MVFRFTCFDFPLVPPPLVSTLSVPTPLVPTPSAPMPLVPTPTVSTEIPNNDNNTQSSSYYTANTQSSRYDTANTRSSSYYSAEDDFPETHEEPDGLCVFTYVELTRITRNFGHSSKIGEGEFGSIYKGSFYFQNRGILQVFIKELKGAYEKGRKQWVKEVKVLGSIDHPNLVKLVGYCVKGNEISGMQLFLVYEHMAGISLGECIFENPYCFYDNIILGWSSRLKVAIDVARGLACLHKVMHNQAAFGDFNYSNVHVDGDTVKLSKFGLHQNGLAHVSTEDTGNMEYIAPEYIDGGHLTAKNDVWSYGVFLFELINGKRLPLLLDTNRPTNEQNLLDWVKLCIDSENFEEITDPRIDRTYPLKSVQSLCIIANMCLSRKPESRPEMRQVLEMVYELTTKESETSSPAPPLQSLVPTDVHSVVPTDVQGLVPTDVQHTKSSCIPRICRTKLLNSCFRKRYCCAKLKTIS